MATRINQAEQYFRVKVESASPMELIYILYDGAVRDIEEAKCFAKKRERQKFTDSIIHAQKCVGELRNALNFEAGEIAIRLNNLYSYIINTLINVTVANDNNIAPLDGVKNMLLDLKSTWKQAEKQMQSQKTQLSQQSVSLSV
ncbi:MAG: flagellar export chaperone FliS [Candidatus Aureabacteria bacterium]|nr:flagellar export chaperone FliS [Candidatus Auribacterota bacterium]